LRDYGFDLEDMPFSDEGHLPLGIDPKLAWAEMHLARAPIDINRADRRDLLRVPGIGPRTADALLHARREQRIHDLSQLKKFGVAAARVAPFVLLDGKRPAHQPSLFAM
jgi:predicted DNA-binding helix-hairpin-helix protein